MALWTLLWSSHAARAHRVCAVSCVVSLSHAQPPFPLLPQDAEFLPDVPNVNVPKSLGVVMPRQILEDWSAIGFDPWSAGKQLRTTTLVSDLSALERKTVPEEEERVSAARVLGESVGAFHSLPSLPCLCTLLSRALSHHPCAWAFFSVSVCLCVCAADAVALAANSRLSKEQEQLERLFSLCRHGKYTEIEEVSLLHAVRACDHKQSVPAGSRPCALSIAWQMLTPVVLLPCAGQIMLGPDLMIPVDYTDAAGNTLLQIACQNGNKRIAKLCLRRGANINHQNVRGLPA